LKCLSLCNLPSLFAMCPKHYRIIFSPLAKLEIIIIKWFKIFFKLIIWWRIQSLCIWLEPFLWKCQWYEKHFRMKLILNTFWYFAFVVLETFYKINNDKWYFYTIKYRDNFVIFFIFIFSSSFSFSLMCMYSVRKNVLKYHFSKNA
jgi:hypothetical protein